MYKIIETLPPAPKDLDKWGKQVYRDLGDLLMSQGRLCDVDMLLFPVMCMLGGALVEQAEHIKTLGNDVDASQDISYLNLIFQTFSGFAESFTLRPKMPMKIKTENRLSILDFVEK